MALLAPFGRSAVDPPLPTGSPCVAPAKGPDEVTRRLEIGRFLVHLLLGGTGSVFDQVAELEGSVDEHVVAWSPTSYATSRAALVQSLADADDALARVQVAIVGEAVTDATSYIEWRATGTFANAVFRDDDVLVEATGATVTASGVMVLTFAGTRVTEIRCYYDARALDEQLLAR
jgi:ketosteroid isomerase-like protein